MTEYAHNNLMTNMLNLPGFGDLHTFSMLDESRQETPSMPMFPGKEQDQRATEAAGSSPLEAEFKPRSTKKNLMVPQTSFEDGFLKEHSQAFKLEAEAYLSAAYGGNFPDHFMSAEIYGFEQPMGNLKMALMTQRSLLSGDTLAQFIKDLSAQKKLEEFLQFVCMNSYTSVAEELVFIAHQVYDAHVARVQNEMGGIDVEKIDLLTTQFIELRGNELFDSEIMTNLCLRHGCSPVVRNNELRSLFLRFLEFYVKTVFLVCSEFFTNPNYQVESFRRIRSFPSASDSFEGEEGCPFDLHPSKKPKY